MRGASRADSGAGGSAAGRSPARQSRVCLASLSLLSSLLQHSLLEHILGLSSFVQSTSERPVRPRTEPKVKDYEVSAEYREHGSVGIRRHAEAWLWTGDIPARRCVCRSTCFPFVLGGERALNALDEFRVHLLETVARPPADLRVLRLRLARAVLRRFST
jgi:hypothetical protein